MARRNLPAPKGMGQGGSGLRASIRRGAGGRVFLSECLLRQSKIGEAAETLASVKIEELHPAEQVDYAFGFATLAIETNERAKLEQAKQVLKSVKVPDPHFRERRDAFLLNVQEALASEDHQRWPSEQRACSTRYDQPVHI